jgi:hypothetical protein
VSSRAHESARTPSCSAGTSIEVEKKNTVGAERHRTAAAAERPGENPSSPAIQNVPATPSVPPSTDTAFSDATASNPQRSTSPTSGM